jgi:hypothetical protein
MTTTQQVGLTIGTFITMNLLWWWFYNSQLKSKEEELQKTGTIKF